MGMNSLICLNSQDLVILARTVKGGKADYKAALEKYTRMIQKDTKEWWGSFFLISLGSLFPR